MEWADRPSVVVMGVSGSGKTTVGTLLARRMGVAFIEGDDLHSSGSKDKMRAGVPLDDDDREPWLERIAAQIRDARAARRAVVVACSALKHRYRDVLAAADPALVFVHLAMPRPVIATRLGAREHEYMPTSLLESQFDSLEAPRDDERHLTLDVSPSPDELVRTIIAELNADAGRAIDDAGTTMPHR